MGVFENYNFMEIRFNIKESIDLLKSKLKR